MKKYLSIIFILIIGMFCLSGCDGLYSGLRGNLTIDFKNGGKADVSVMCAFKDWPKEYAAWFDEEKIRSSGNLGAYKDWEYEPYEQDGFIGVSFTKRDIEISDVAGLIEAIEEDDADDTSTVTLEKKGRNYVFDCRLYDESDASSRKTMDLLKEISDSEVTFVIKVPFKAANSNATSVSEDGRVLEWDLLSMDENNLHAEFYVDAEDQNEKSGSPDIKLIVSIAIALFFLICLIVALVFDKKRFWRR